MSAASANQNTSSNRLMLDPRIQELIELAENSQHYRAIAHRGRVQFASTFGFLVFLIFSTALYLADIVLVGFGISGDNLNYQYYIFIASSVLTVFAHISAAVCIDEASMALPKKLVILLDGPAVMECICIIVGWVFLGSNPGVSALRCLRVFRQFWHIDNLYRSLNPATKSKFGVLSIALFCRQFIQYADKVGVELFTSKSRGGLSVLGIYFFITYLFAVLFWLEGADVPIVDRGYVCNTLSHCYITMIRLSVFDEGGLDYMAAVQDSKQHTKYTVCLVLYIVLSSVILFSALVGAFGYGLVLSVRGKEREVHVLNNGNNRGAAQAEQIQRERQKQEHDVAGAVVLAPQRSRRIIDNVTKISVKTKTKHGNDSLSQSNVSDNGSNKSGDGDQFFSSNSKNNSNNQLDAANSGNSDGRVNLGSLTAADREDIAPNSSVLNISSAEREPRVNFVASNIKSARSQNAKETESSITFGAPMNSNDAEGITTGRNTALWSKEKIHSMEQAATDGDVENESAAKDDHFDGMIDILHDIRGEVMLVSSHVKHLMVEIDQMKHKL